jgi:hypothetical protein
LKDKNLSMNEMNLPSPVASSIFHNSPYVTITDKCNVGYSGGVFGNVVKRAFGKFLEQFLQNNHTRLSQSVDQSARP